MIGAYLAIYQLQEPTFLATLYDSPPKKPILESNIDDYIRGSIQELIILLHKQQSNIPGTTSPVNK